MARPTKYTEDMLSKAELYLIEYSDNGDVVPSIAGLALFLGISRETVRDWASDPEKVEFSGIVRDLMSQQEQKLLNGALLNAYNASIAKLMLTKHGYTDKAENTVVGNPDKPIKHTIEFISGSPTDS